MKFKIDDSQQKKIWTIIFSGCLVIVLYFALTNLGGLFSLISGIIDMIMPFILGFALAFVLTPLSRFIEGRLLSRTKLKFGLKRMISVVLSMLSALLVVGVFLIIGIPSLVVSIREFSAHFDGYIKTFTELLNHWNERWHVSDEFSVIITSALDEIYTYFSNYFKDNLPVLINASISFVSSLMNLVIAFIISVYLLIDRERFSRQVKRVNYALFPQGIADELVNLVHMGTSTFNRFIITQAIESCILAIVSFGLMSLLNIEYAGIICVILAITNMIPIFGPYLGGIPSAFLLLIVNPLHALIFAVMILILQQLAHSFLSPRLFKDGLGIPSFWILIAIVIGGGLFGVIGMFWFVPLFAVIYEVIAKGVNTTLNEKEDILNEVYKD